MSEYGKLKTRRLRNLLKQISLIDSRLSFEEDNYKAAIRYTLSDEEQKDSPLRSYVVLDFLADKSRTRYVGLLKKLCGDIQRHESYDISNKNLGFSCLDEYILKLSIRGGK